MECSVDVHCCMLKESLCEMFATAFGDKYGLSQQDSLSLLKECAKNNSYFVVQDKSTQEIILVGWVVNTPVCCFIESRWFKILDEQERTNVKFAVERWLRRQDFIQSRQVRWWGAL